MPYNWSQDEYKRLPQHVQELRDLLEDWFWAIETGTVKSRMPNPDHPSGVTQEAADGMVALLDKGFDRELGIWANRPEAGGYQAGPDFYRLAPSQRLALAQAICGVLKEQAQVLRVDTHYD